MASNAGSELVNEILLEDPLLDSVGATCSWGVGNQMCVVAGNVGARNNARTLPPLYIHEVKWGLDMHEEIMRKLLNESHQIFVEVQENKSDLCKGAQSKSLQIKFSRKYRSILRACALELKSEIDGDVVDEGELVQQMELLRIMEVIWDLCETLFLENSPSGVILTRLAEWCKWHFTQADDYMEECIQVEQPHSHELYWSAIKCLVFQGRTEDAHNMLKLHPHCKDNVDNSYTSMTELLRKMPHFLFHGGQSIVEFEMKWNHWQDECRRRLSDGEFGENSKLKEIAMILCGNEEVFQNPEYGGWYQMMVARLLYTQPTVSMLDLHHQSKLSVEILGGRGRLGAFDQILLAAFELDPYLVLKECSEKLSNWWLSSHLADLFHHSGLLSQKKLDFEMDFREFLIVEYASSLMSNDSFWRVIVDYLSACSDNDHNYLSLYVDRIPITSEKKASKILKICEKHKLVSEARSICRQMSMSALQKNNLGTALMWCLRSNDHALTVHIAEQMLSEYAASGEFAYVDQLDYLGPAILASEKLTFLGKYRDFHKLLSQGMMIDAGRLLFNIINIAPRNFLPSLLADSLPLLECEELVYRKEESATFLGFLNSVQECDLTQKLEHLRLALARNMARAIVTVN